MNLVIWFPCFGGPGGWWTRVEERLFSLYPFLPFEFCTNFKNSCTSYLNIKFSFSSVNLKLLLSILINKKDIYLNELKTSIHTKTCTKYS